MVINTMSLIALTETSLDAFFGSNTASQATNGNDNKMAHLPFDHGRKPISEEEMIAINVIPHPP